jgi:hypothetical protein
MKFARANLSIVSLGTVDRTGQRRGQHGSNILLQLRSDRPLRISRPFGELAARWHVSPETGRIECRWLLDRPPADDYYLCAGYIRAKRRLRPSQRRSPERRWSIARVTKLSINP